MERSSWEHLVDEIKNDILSGYFVLTMTENGQLRVSRDHVNNSWSVVTEEMPEFHAILEVVGPIEPGSWLNGYGYVGSYSRPDDLRYVGEMPKSSGKHRKVFGQISATDILGRQKQPPMMAPDADSFEKLMLTGSYDKIEVCEDGSFDVWDMLIDGKEGNKVNYPEDSPLKGVIEKHVGPLKPGDVIDFEKLGEYKFKIRRRPLD